jgi:hypothetical protein
MGFISEVVRLEMSRVVIDDNLFIRGDRAVSDLRRGLTLSLIEALGSTQLGQQIYPGLISGSIRVSHGRRDA